MDEVWKDIEGYEGLYQVSNTGQVKSLNYNQTGEIKVLKQGNAKGYKRVGLFKNGKTKQYSVHRLVALAFISNPDDLPMVNHKDEDKTNNNVNNLEWCTHEYNMSYGTRNERISKKHKGKHRSEETKKKISKSLRGENSPFYGKHLSEEHKKKMSESHKGKYKGKDHPGSKPILMYDKKGNFIRRFDSTADANEYFGKDRSCSNITLCLRGKNKTAYGFIFKYENK